MVLHGWSAKTGESGLRRHGNHTNRDNWSSVCRVVVYHGEVRPVVIPTCGRQAVICMLHEGHPGI